MDISIIFRDIADFPFNLGPKNLNILRVFKFEWLLANSLHPLLKGKKTFIEVYFMYSGSLDLVHFRDIAGWNPEKLHISKKNRNIEKNRNILFFRLLITHLNYVWIFLLHFPIFYKEKKCFKIPYYIRSYCFFRLSLVIHQSLFGVFVIPHFLDRLYVLSPIKMLWHFSFSLSNFWVSRNERLEVIRLNWDLSLRERLSNVNSC